MSQLKCDVLVVGPVMTNCYFLYREDTMECVLVDPGDEFNRIKAMVEKKGLKVQAVLLTHGHFDHILAVEQVRTEYDVPVYAPEEEKEVLQSAGKNLSSMMGGAPITLDADIYLKDGEEIELLGRMVRCIATPGHTCGGMCYYLPEELLLFSGDTLFQESVGRTDFPTSSMSMLIRSIRTKLFVLPGEVRVLSGHGEMTTIQNEKQFNPFAVE